MEIDEKDAQMQSSIEESSCVTQLADSLVAARLLLHRFIYSAALTGREQIDARACEARARAALIRASSLGLVTTARPEDPRRHAK